MKNFKKLPDEHIISQWSDVLFRAKNALVDLHLSTTLNYHPEYLVSRNHLFSNLLHSIEEVRGDIIQLSIYGTSKFDKKRKKQ